MRPFLKNSNVPDASAVINIDGGKVDDLVIGGIGGIKWQAEISGIASHAGVHPNDGVSAASVFSVALADLTRDGLAWCCL